MQYYFERQKHITKTCVTVCVLCVLIFQVGHYLVDSEGPRKNAINK